jgi:hypothetical protein
MDADKPFLVILVKRATIFLAVVCSISLYFWVVGSESAFLDETQAMLLSIVRVSSLGIIVSSGFGILISAAMAAARRFRPRAFGILAYVVVGAMGVAALALSQYVSLLSRGLP